MVRHCSEIPPGVMNLIRHGTVLPAHPLALDENRRLDPIRQRAVTRYYIDAGAGGVAVGVHTTQFAIRGAGLYEQVLRIAAEVVAEGDGVPKVLVAGVTGRTDQAVREAEVARNLGYHVALLNVAALRGAAEHDVLDHCRRVAAEIPIVGFALLPGVGGMHLSYEFWTSFAQIENVVAIKMAPFDRYRTIDIVRAVVDAGAVERVTLYTGNDDHIGLDLIVPFVVRSSDGRKEVRARIRGGLLGHWSVWTRTAVQLLERIHAVGDGADVPADILALDSIVTDCNGAIYDAANGLRGCIPGCLEILKRQGLLRGTWCLDPNEVLSAGQSEAIDRVYAQYPEMNDDAFVRANLHRWLSDRASAIPLVA
jgi:Dihydrodipicolinate synthetase family